MRYSCEIQDKHMYTYAASVTYELELAEFIE